MKHIFLSAAALLACLTLSAQKYKGIVDKTVAVVGGETILLSDIEAEVQQLRASGAGSDRDMRCEVLEQMLSDVYSPCAMTDRFTYIEGSTSAGMIIYEDEGFAYSHHSTDPAGGQLCNAFDLVRIHRFGELFCFKSDGTFNLRITCNKALVNERICIHLRLGEHCKIRIFVYVKTGSDIRGLGC